jgi:sulfur carrier protein
VAVPVLEITVNGIARQIAEPADVASLLAELGLAGKFLAVEVNRQLVPRARHAEHRLANGDCVEIVTLVGGG